MLIGQYCQIGTITRIRPRVNLGMFDQNNGERMRATSGSDHVTVGGIRVQPADPATEVGILARHQKELLGDTLIYLGSVQSTERVTLGTQFTLALGWAPSKPLSQDHTFRLKIVAPDGSVGYDLPWSPLGGEFPISRWLARGIVRDVVFHDSV